MRGVRSFARIGIFAPRLEPFSPPFNPPLIKFYHVTERKAMCKQPERKPREDSHFLIDWHFMKVRIPSYSGSQFLSLVQWIKNLCRELGGDRYAILIKRGIKAGVTLHTQASGSVEDLVAA